MSRNTDSAPLLELGGLSVTYAGSSSAAVRDAALTVHAGECVALVGASGSGKSTLARAALGLTGKNSVVRAQTLTVAGKDVSRFSERDWNRFRGRKVGLVLQDALASLDPLRTVGQEIAEPLAAHRIRPRSSRTEKVQRLLEQVHLTDIGDRLRDHPHQFSGGQRQRILIASALAARPALLIADEPTTALDVRAQARILELFAELRESGLAVVLVSHDLSVVAAVADRVLVMSEGKIVEQGPVDEVLHHPRHQVTRALTAAIPGRAAAEPGNRIEIGEPVLDMKSVKKRFGSETSFRGIRSLELTVRRRESVAVVGESGSGKSTVALLALGLLQPDSGTVLFGGQPWSSEPEKRCRSRRGQIQLIHQDTYSAFDPRYTVTAILDEALAAAGTRSAHLGQRRSELLESVGLGDEFLDRKARTLSGGQRQRLAIARALASDPELRVCDEPVSALDLVSQAAILALLKHLRESRGLTVLFISHDLAVVRELCERVIVMRDGEIVEQGQTEAIWNTPNHPYTRALLADRLGSTTYEGAHTS